MASGTPPATYRRFEVDRRVLHRGGSTPDASWANLGLWDGARSYAEACEALALCVGRAAQLGESTRVLDAAFGHGDELALWVTRFAVASVVGVEVQPAGVAAAQRRIAAQGLEHRVRAVAGSATDLRAFGDRSVDAVVCVDAAYHFAPRQRFFEEAFRVLAPGGRLALTDVALARAPGRVASAVVAAAARACAIPVANLGTPDAYCASVAAAGFGDVRVAYLDARVLAGFAGFMRTHWRAHWRDTPGGGWGKLLATGWAAGLAARGARLHYVLVTATRPGSP